MNAEIDDHRQSGKYHRCIGELLLLSSVQTCKRQVSTHLRFFNGMRDPPCPPGTEWLPLDTVQRRIATLDRMTFRRKSNPVAVCVGVAVQLQTCVPGRKKEAE